MKYRDALDWVLQILQRTRGRELPGNFNPLIIGHLFQEQSEPWQQIALDHVHQVAKTCSRFVEAVLNHVAAPEARERLLDMRVKPGLTKALREATAELERVMKDKTRHPITYNHYYTTTIQKLRQAREGRLIEEKAQKARVEVSSQDNHKGWTSDGSSYKKTFIDPSILGKSLDTGFEIDMDRFSAAEALDGQAAFYKVLLHSPH